MLSTWHGVHADLMAAGSNLKGGAPSFRQFEQNTLCCHHDGRLSCIWKMKATERKSPDGSRRVEAADESHGVEAAK